MKSIRSVKENDKLKKVVKHLVEKKSNQKECLLGMCRSLWGKFRTREREEDDSSLRDGSPLEIATV